MFVAPGSEMSIAQGESKSSASDFLQCLTTGPATMSGTVATGGSIIGVEGFKICVSQVSVTKSAPSVVQ